MTSSPTMLMSESSRSVATLTVLSPDGVVDLADCSTADVPEEADHSFSVPAADSAAAEMDRGAGLPPRRGLFLLL